MSAHWSRDAGGRELILHSDTELEKAQYLLDDCFVAVWIRYLLHDAVVAFMDCEHQTTMIPTNGTMVGWE